MVQSQEANILHALWLQVGVIVQVLVQYVIIRQLDPWGESPIPQLHTFKS